MRRNKIILIACMLLLLAFTITRLLNDDKKVITLLKPQYENKESQIIEGDNFIKYVSDIGNVKDIMWINENIVQFRGSSKNNDEFHPFQFDFTKKKLSKNYTIEEGFYHKDFNEALRFIKEINKENYIIYTEGMEKRGLFHVRKDSKPIMLSENIDFKDELLFKMADNGEKIAYYDNGEKIIKVYNVLNNKVTKIEEEINEEMLKNFKNNVNFSYEAGYLTIANINREDFKESYFSVYGADSGKLYAEKLLGINPVWGKDNLTTAFIYLEDNSIANTHDTDGEKLVGDRVGFYNLKTRKIKYTEDMGKDYKVIRPVLWKNKSEALIVVGKYFKDQERYIFNRIYSYGLKNNVLANLEGYFKDINSIGNDFDITLLENYLYIAPRNEKQENYFKVVNLDNRSEKEFKNMGRFTTNLENRDKGALYKCLDANKFLYIHDNGIYITDLKSRHLKYKTNGKVTGLYESPDKSNLLIINEKGESSLEFTIMKL